MPEDVYRRLEALTRLGANVRLARYTPDLPEQLRQAELSVSMAGYNTVMDILSTQVRALVYPVTANGDQEQFLRAAKLARMGVLAVLDGEQLEPVRLALQIVRALRNRPSQITLNLAGAENSALVVQKHLGLRNASASQTFTVVQESRRAFHREGNTHTIGASAPCD